MKNVAMGIASLALAGALAGCQANYENEARAVAAAQNAESAAARAETAATRVEQAAGRVETAAQRAESVVVKAEEQEESRGRRR